MLCQYLIAKDNSIIGLIVDKLYMEDEDYKFKYEKLLEENYKLTKEILSLKDEIMSLKDEKKSMEHLLKYYDDHYKKSEHSFIKFIKHGNIDGVIATIEHTNSMKDLRIDFEYKDDFESYRYSHGFEKEYLNVIYKRATPLHVASIYGHIAIVQYLIKMGVDVMAKTITLSPDKQEYNMTALDLAKRYNHSEVVKYLEKLQ